MPPSDTKPRLELPVQTVSEWTSVPDVRHALTRMERGQFFRAAQLCDSMGRDDRVTGTLDVRVRTLLGIAMTFEASGDKRRGSSIAKDVESWWWEAFPEDEIAQLLRWGVFLGVGIGEIVWKRDANRWVPRLKTWHPQHLYWDESSRSYWLQTADGNLEITPGDGKWVLFAPHGLRRGWMNARVRSLAIPWLIRQWVMRDWARYSEVHGLGTKKATVPSGASKEDKEQFLDDLRTLNSEGLVLLEKDHEGHGYDYDLVEAKANTWEGFDRLWSRTDVSIAIAVLGQNLTTEVQSGSRAAATVHDDVRQDLLDADAASLATTLREQVLVPWARYNLGDGHLAPWPKWETEPPKDRKLEAETLKVLGEAITALRNGGVNVDAKTLAENYEIPLLAGEIEPPEDAEPDPEPDAKKKADPKPPTKTSLKLASGKPAPPGFLEGQAYADRVVELATTKASEEMGDLVARLLKRMDEVDNYDDLAAALPDLFAATDAARLALLTTDATVLAELAGRLSVKRDNRTAD